MRVAIVDYGVGNVLSVLNGLRYLGYDARVTSAPQQLLSADALVMPGVGAYRAAMTRLQSGALRETLDHVALERKTPILGICLGMQLMMEGSDEGGKVEGLGWFKGWTRVLSEDAATRVPHIGWNSVEAREPEKSGLFGSSSLGSYYFCHSFRVECGDENIAGTTTHGVPFPSAIHRDNLYGVQFHPEKSQVAGLKLLRAFFRKVELTLC